MQQKIILTISLFCALTFNISAQTGNYNQIIDNIANKLATSISKKGKNTITITSFLNVENNLTELGIDVANDLEAALLTTDYNFTLVSRDELNRILEEQKISRSRITEKENVKRIGQISNVDVMIIGEVSSWGEQIRVNAKLLDVETANLIGAAKGEVTATGVVKKKFDKIIGFTSTTPDPDVDPLLPPPVHTATHGNFEINLISCKQIGQKIACDLTIKSKNKDDQLYMYSQKSRIFDRLGHEFKGSKVEVGDVSASTKVYKDFVADIKVKSGIEFSGINRVIKSIPKMEITIYTSNRYHKVTFRNVKVN